MVTGAGAQDTATPQRDGVSLAIYNQGTALVRDQRAFKLVRGENTVDFTDVAATIDRTSVTVKSTPDAEAVRVLEQSYLYDLVGLSGLLRRYTDSRIVVTMDDGATHAGALLTGQGTRPMQLQLLPSADRMILSSQQQQQHHVIVHYY